jgi:hypothetical protein
MTTGTPLPSTFKGSHYIWGVGATIAELGPVRSFQKFRKELGPSKFIAELIAAYDKDTNPVASFTHGHLVYMFRAVNKLQCYIAGTWP